MIRSIVNATVDPMSATPPTLNLVEAANFNNDPKLNLTPSGSDPGQLAYNTLSDDVRSFSVGEGSTPQSVHASLILFRPGVTGPTGGQKKVDQSFQMDVDLTPQNTYPRSAN